MKKKNKKQKTKTIPGQLYKVFISFFCCFVLSVYIPQIINMLLNVHRKSKRVCWGKAVSTQAIVSAVIYTGYCFSSESNLLNHLAVCDFIYTTQPRDQSTSPKQLNNKLNKAKLVMCTLHLPVYVKSCVDCLWYIIKFKQKFLRQCMFYSILFVVKAYKNEQKNRKNIS